MVAPLIVIDRHGPVTTLTINRPEVRNAVDAVPLIDGSTVRLPREAAMASEFELRLATIEATGLPGVSDFRGVR